MNPDKPNEDEDAFSNSLWKFTKLDYKKDYLFGDQYVLLKYSYTFERKSLYYKVNILAPIIFLFIITMATFWMPADCGEQASICITILLAFSVYALIITEHTPITSDVVPNISRFYV